MPVTIGLAFLAGVVTVLSPCVLPLLPVIFATAAQEGRSRPLGVVIGFVGSFTLATLALNFLVRSLGLPPDINRILASAILVALGLLLAVPPFHHTFERHVGALVGRLPRGKGGSHSGLLGGLAVGAGLGLAWSPCVGPIMASVITLALNQQVSAGAAAVALAFSLGTALPMAAVLVGGRGLVTRLRWLQANAVLLQRAMGSILVLTGLAILTGWDRSIQTQLLIWFPGWEQALTGWEPRPYR
ncbi:cytochrome c biogenesis CcdA family protein [Mesorhizobium sp. 1B3]|uniref:cytochrome c biogenesis CcdA family protein n=1 Tax=Mesorhizobium sp. 1B3 TaxID=3243599 RepID=UPI003D9877D8